MTLKRCDICGKLEDYKTEIKVIDYPVSHICENGQDWYIKNERLDVCEECRLKICKVSTRDNTRYNIQ